MVWPDRPGVRPDRSGRPDRPAGLRQPCCEVIISDQEREFVNAVQQELFQCECARSKHVCHILEKLYWIDEMCLNLKHFDAI